jgi:PIN domain nuclease of toxin-antitoxin system
LRGYLLDTHIWFWYLTASRRLPPTIKKRLLESPKSSWLSPISIWEISMLARKGRIALSTDVRSWVTSALSKMPVREAPLNFEVALKSQEIRLSHEDPADHFLVATALTYDLVLMTVDRRLSCLPGVPAFPG